MTDTTTPPATEPTTNYQYVGEQELWLTTDLGTADVVTGSIVQMPQGALDGQDAWVVTTSPATVPPPPDQEPDPAADFTDPGSPGDGTPIQDAPPEPSTPQNPAEPVADPAPPLDLEPAGFPPSPSA